MSGDQLQQFLSSNQNDYLEFLQRFQADPSSISDEEASQRYRELMSQLPPGAAAEVHSQVLAQLAPDQRRQIAAQFRSAHDDPSRPFSGYDTGDLDDAAQPRTLGLMSQRASAQDPDLFGQIFGPNSPLNGPLGKMLMSALAAYLAQRVLGGQANSRNVPDGPVGTPRTGGQNDPIGDILGGILGGQQGRTSVPGGTGGTSGGTGGGLGDILGGLLGGGSGNRSGQGGGGLGDILGGILGGQQGRTGQSGGLDDILGDILRGGGNAGNTSGTSTGSSTRNTSARNTSTGDTSASDDSDVETPQQPKRSHRRYD